MPEGLNKFEDPTEKSLKLAEEALGRANHFLSSFGVMTPDELGVNINDVPMDEWSGVKKIIEERTKKAGENLENIDMEAIKELKKIRDQVAGLVEDARKTKHYKEKLHIESLLKGMGDLMDVKIKEIEVRKKMPAVLE